MAYMECLGYVPSLAAFPKAKNQSHDVGVSELRGGFCDTTSLHWPQKGQSGEVGAANQSMTP